MIIKYYAWKNGKKTEGKQDWVEITQDEYIKICHANRNLKQEERRYFYQMPEFENGDNYLFLECNYEQYKKSRAERYKRTKIKKELEEREERGERIYSVSFDEIFEDESGNSYTRHDSVADPDSLFEDQLLLSMDVQAALEMLTADELEIVDKLYLSEFVVGERELARQMGIPVMTLHNRKKKVFDKLKKNLVQ